MAIQTLHRFAQIFTFFSAYLLPNPTRPNGSYRQLTGPIRGWNFYRIPAILSVKIYSCVLKNSPGFRSARICGICGLLSSPRTHLCSHLRTHLRRTKPLILLVCHTCHGLKSLPAGEYSGLTDSLMVTNHPSPITNLASLAACAQFSWPA